MLQRTFFTAAILLGLATVSTQTAQAMEANDCQIVETKLTGGAFIVLGRPPFSVRADDARAVAWRKDHFKACWSDGEIAHLFVPAKTLNEARDSLVVWRRL